MKETEFMEAALDALTQYQEGKIFNLDKVQNIFDALEINVKLEPFDKADLAVLAIVLALQLKQ